MKTALTILIFSGAVLAPAEPLSDVLARMDRAAADFHSLSARMKRVQFTAVLSESSEMDGTVRLRRTKNGTQGIVEFQQPEQRTVFINGKQVQIYYPEGENRRDLRYQQIHVEHGPDPAAGLWHVGSGTEEVV